MDIGVQFKGSAFWVESMTFSQIWIFWSASLVQLGVSTKIFMKQTDNSEKIASGQETAALATKQRQP